MFELCGHFEKLHTHQGVAEAYIVAITEAKKKKKKNFYAFVCICCMRCVVGNDVLG